MNFIEIIDLTSNQLDQIEFNNFQFIRNSLIQIHLSHNRLKKLSKQALASLPNLQFLSLSSNFLATLPDDLLLHDYALQEINLSSNLLINLPTKLFLHNYKLTTIDLRYNLIKKLPNHLFTNCSHLEQLRLDHNNLREFPLNAFTSRNLNSIKVISLAFNFIEHLNSLASDIYRNLIYLNLSHNSIKQFDSSLFTNLIQLDISFNKLQFDEAKLFANFYSTKHLTHVDLSNCGLREMPASLNLPNLISLNLARNLLTIIYSHSFGNIEHLHILNLSHNRLTNVPNNLFNQKLGETLIELDLSHNLIYTLNNDSFIGLKKLQKLSINSLHRLHYVQLGVFQPLPLLKELEISYYERQITSLCHLFQIANLHIETLIIHFDHHSSISFNRKFLHDSSLCNLDYYKGLGRKLKKIHFTGTSIKSLNSDVLSAFTNDQLILKFTNTSIKHLTLDLSESIQALDLHFDKSFQSNLAINSKSKVSSLYILYIIYIIYMYIMHKKIFFFFFFA